MTHLRVLTYNTANDFVSPNDLENLLGRWDADIVGLQEVSVQVASELHHRLHARYPHRVLFGEHIKGKGLFSRHPLVRFDTFVLASGRPYIEADIAIGTTLVRVLVAHPPPGSVRKMRVTTDEAAADIASLIERLPVRAPALLIGDFNCIRGSAGYRLLRRAGLVDTFRVSGHGPGRTYPMRHGEASVQLPRLFRLDYIWATSHFVPLHSYVAHGVGSDHLPLVSELTLA